MPRKFIALSIAVVSGAIVVACATDKDVGEPRPEPPSIYVGGGELATPADLYAQRYESSIAQVSDGENYRFIDCREACPGATLKTPIKNLAAAVAQRAARTVAARASAVAHQNGPARPASRNSNTNEYSQTAKAVRTSFPVAEHRDLSERPLRANPATDASTEMSTKNQASEREAEVDPQSTSSRGLLDTVTFLPGSAWLDPTGELEVATIAREWTNAKDARSEPRPLLVAGFTDSTPTKSANFNHYLARRRAETVREALLRGGIPDDVVHIEAHVECCYAADNKTEHGRAMNRRAEIHVL